MAAAVNLHVYGDLWGYGSNVRPGMQKYKLTHRPRALELMAHPYSSSIQVTEWVLVVKKMRA